MAPPFRKHVFVCLHERSNDESRGDCTSKGSPELLKALKKALKKRGLSDEIRANKSGCLDNCAEGCSVVVYPEGVWYGHVELDDIEELVDQHLVGGKPVERLQLFTKSGKPPSKP